MAVTPGSTAAVIASGSRWPEARARKFRQAAFVYLHVALLYEMAAYVMWRQDLLPRNWGAGWIWLVAGGLVGGGVFLGLLRWQHQWFARVIWVVHGLRLPTLIHRAFITTDLGPIDPSFYLVAIVVVVINLWTLARAAWDL
jgi:hypothetical protein